MSTGNPDELVLSRSRVRREIESLRDLLEKKEKGELEVANLRGQIGMLRKLLRDGALDARNDPPPTKAQTEAEPKLYD